MGLIILLINGVRQHFFLPVLLYLCRQEPQVLQVVFLFQFCLVDGDEVLLLLLPAKLLSLEFPRLFDLVALLLESGVGQVVDFLQVLDVLSAFLLGVVIYFKGALRAHEVGVSLGVVVGGHLLPIKCQANYGSHIVFCVVHGSCFLME